MKPLRRLFDRCDGHLFHSWNVFMFDRESYRLWADCRRCGEVQWRDFV